MFSEIKCIFIDIVKNIETVGDIFNLILFILLVIMVSPLVLIDAIMHIPIKNKKDRG